MSTSPSSSTARLGAVLALARKKTIRPTSEKRRRRAKAQGCRIRIAPRRPPVSTVLTRPVVISILMERWRLVESVDVNYLGSRPRILRHPRKGETTCVFEHRQQTTAIRRPPIELAQMRSSVRRDSIRRGNRDSLRERGLPHLCLRSSDRQRRLQVRPSSVVLRRRRYLQRKRPWRNREPN